MLRPKPDVLLHVCCAPCATYVLQVLSEEYTIATLFYNPNIYPESEYAKRLSSMQQYCKQTGTDSIIADYDFAQWQQQVHGHEADHEGGRRCALCIEMRLQKTSAIAVEHDINVIATTLTISPHKNADVINSLGSSIFTSLLISKLVYQILMM